MSEMQNYELIPGKLYRFTKRQQQTFPEGRCTLAKGPWPASGESKSFPGDVVMMFLKIDARSTRKGDIMDIMAPYKTANVFMIEGGLYSTFRTQDDSIYEKIDTEKACQEVLALV